jgi:hypothetical protein
MPDAFFPSCKFPLDILSNETIARLEALAAEQGVSLQTVITEILDRELARALGRNN